MRIDTPTQLGASTGASTGAPLRAIGDLPGPRGLPLLGNQLQIQPKRLHQIMERWSREYGDFFRIRLVSREFLVVASAEAIAAILRDRPDGFQRTSRICQVAGEMGFSGLFTANGDAWRRQRPMVMAGFDPAHIKSYFPTLVKVTERFARRWQRAAEAGEPIDLLADLMRYTVDVTAGLAFGSDINTLESDQEVIQSHLDKIFPALFRRLLAPVPYWRYFKLPADRRLQPHLVALRKAVEGFIEQARRRLAENPELRRKPTNLIEAMIAARDVEASGLSDKDVAGNVLTMLLAGEDTTANTLGWMIYLLHRHPDAHRRAREEVRAALGTDAYPSRYEQLASLGYVEACAHETMRLKPVAPIQMQQAVRNRVVAGIFVPAGTMLMCLTRPAATDEAHFEDAGAFKPERWLGDSPPAQGAGAGKRFAMPFGGGPRICPGRYLALQEMKMAVGMLFGSFDIDNVTTADGGEPQERMAFTMAPVGLRLKLSRANHAAPIR